MVMQMKYSLIELNYFNELLFNLKVIHQRRKKRGIDCIMNTIVYSVYTITIIDLAW